MKKFILLSYSFSGMGGGQMYQRNKLEYMKKNNYEVAAAYSVEGEIVIEELKEYKGNCIKWFSINPMILSKRKIESVIKDLIAKVGKIDNDTIIETNNKVLSMWGEIISQKFNSINFIYIIDEKIGSLEKSIIEFFEFKKQRKELYGIKDETYEMIFNEKLDEQEYQYKLPVVCSNVVADCVNEKIEKIEYSELNLATIGRLEKEYVPTLIEEIKIFAKNNKNITISYIMVGGTKNNEIIRKIKKCFENITNLKLFLVGNIYPIPVDFLNKIDIFISSAGSARVSGNIGKPTIAIDARDYNSIGVLYYDTENTVFRKTEEKIRISEKLSFLVENNFYKKIEIKNQNIDTEKYNIDIAFKHHLNKFDEIKDNKRMYYNFQNFKLSKIKKIEKLLLNILGFNVYQKIRFLVFKKIKK